ncbi:NAD(P)/FAD-dependent oxidoreductase [Falsiroseomonas oryzae]|uniref:NAD(P)/FAD-dependent oxidoreductase n=1 Tax=Falsiroseomonas oryzae TaxID=2766473 RepID=UPI0022EB3FED|nr:FAD-binding oxidoreductase [Roseomonas sp. MO-31]
MAAEVAAGDDEADILIIGAGIVGALIGLRLAQCGQDVLVLDAADIGAGASGANAGSLHVQINSHFAIATEAHVIRGVDHAAPLHVAAIESWRRLNDELGDSIELGCEGGLMVAMADRTDLLAAMLDRQRRLGIPVELVTGSAVRRLAPYLSPEVEAVLFCALEGRVNPILATPAAIRAARRAGARFAFSTPVLDLTRLTGSFVVRTPTGVVRSRIVVNAAGAGAADIAKRAGVFLPVEARPFLMNVTEATSAFVPHLVQQAGQRLTLKQARRGNLIIGGGWPSTYGERGVEVQRASVEGNLAVALALVPRLGRINLLRSWGADIYRVPDICPVLGPSAACPGFFVAAAVPNGYTLAPLCAEITAALVQGNAHPLFHDGLSVDRYPPSIRHGIQ